MPSDFWISVDQEWGEIHPDHIEEVLENFLRDSEAAGYIGPQDSTGGPPTEPPPSLFDDDEEEDEEEEEEQPTVGRVMGFFRRLFRGR